MAGRFLRVSIDRFYEEATGDPAAFKKLCQVLPDAIKEATRELNKNAIASTVREELNEISPDTLNSLYLLAFKNYEGFSSFKLG